ncbi:MAG TPA: RluA family pseudouridine synthase [bacterium]|nr:RluA family pseudouridine synthase [bacterium]
MYKIKQEDAGKRLDVFLAPLETKFSRSQLQKLIEKEVIVVNGVAKTSHYKLKLDDEVEILKKGLKVETQKVKVEKKNLPNIQVIFECADYIVVNKPAGLMVHGTATSTAITLVDWLVKNYPKVKKVGEDKLRPGIVHRLDKSVSGLMVIALNNKAFEDLKKQFQARTIDKKYIGLVYGQVSKDAGVINFNLERSSSGHKMAAKPTSQGGKEAITEFVVLERYINFTLLELTIKTGRTHQIRAHLSAFNHQLVGDDWYGTVMTKTKNKKFNLGRVFLASVLLAFDNLEGERVKYELGLPAELKKVLESVK